jgi:hypothetical protein
MELTYSNFIFAFIIIIPDLVSLPVTEYAFCGCCRLLYETCLCQERHHAFIHLLQREAAYLAALIALAGADHCTRNLD